jgi:hypothetical protein
VGDKEQTSIDEKCLAFAADRGHLQSTPLEEVCTSPNDAATVGNIFGTAVVEFFQCHCNIF